MASNGNTIAADAIADALQELSNIEKDFAAVEIDALRQKEYSLKELYSKRQVSIAKIPKFWPVVFANGPDELQDAFSPEDVRLLDALKSMKVERPHIKSDTEGEPRSLRFTFEFEKNELFEDTIVVKDFEFHTSEDGGAFVSTPVTFKWTTKAKKEGVNKLLDLADQLYKAEKAFTDGKIDSKERQTLWQYEKLDQALEEATHQRSVPGFLNWFGYRGLAAAAGAAAKEEEDNDEAGDEELDDVEELEIFPDGDDIAMVLAEELWPNVMDYFVRAQEDDSDDEIDGFDGFDEEDGDEVPNLVETDELAEEDDEENDDALPPAKKPKLS